MKEFTLDGNKFSSPQKFYTYIEEIFTSGLKWETGRNLDAFEDILQGGFGRHAYEEKIRVKWINMKKSREKLSPTFYNALVITLEKTENIFLDKYELRA